MQAYDVKPTQRYVMCSYEDDKDEGEWFLYTGSGGRDLSGNKRTNKARAYCVSLGRTLTCWAAALLITCANAVHDPSHAAVSWPDPHHLMQVLRSLTVWSCRTTPLLAAST